MTTTTTITDQPDLRTEAYKGDDTKRLIVIPLVQNLIGGVAVALLACIALYPLGMLARETVAASIAGGLAIACMVTIFRFFADDFGLLGWAYRQGLAVGRKEFAGELKAAQKRIGDLEVQLKDAQRPVIVERADTKFVRAEVQDAAWGNARNLLVVTDDFGTLPGRGRSELSEGDQAAAIAVLTRAKVIERVGKQYRLTCSQSDAFRALSDLAEKSTASKQASR